MREIPPIERALLGAFIGIAILICAHGASSCAHSKDVGRGSSSPRATVANQSSESARGPSGANPPRASTRVGSELVAISSKLSAAMVPSADAPAVGDGTSSVTSAIPAAGAALLAARVCWVESGWRLADCAAITRVLVRRAERAGWSFDRMARAYSAIERDHARAAFARQLPAGLAARELERWTLLRAVAEGALDGRLSSPCRGALHWGGAELAPDVRRAAKAVREGRWRRVRCSTRTANAFFAEVRRSTLSAREAAPGAAP